MDNKTDARDALKSQAVPGDYGTALAMIFQACYDVMMSKRKVRGTGNILDQGHLALLHRVRQDKLARIQATLEKKEIIRLAMSLNVDPEIRVAMRHDIRFEESGATLHDADYIDDLVDAINYLAIMISLAFNWWGLPMDDDAMTANLVNKVLHDAVVEESINVEADLAFDADRESRMGKNISRD